MLEARGSRGHCGLGLVRDSFGGDEVCSCPSGTGRLSIEWDCGWGEGELGSCSGVAAGVEEMDCTKAERKKKCGEWIRATRN